MTSTVSKNSNPSEFVFDKTKATALKYTNRKPQDTQTVCVDFEKHFPAGDHILSIVPVSDKKIMIGIIILP